MRDQQQIRSNISCWWCLSRFSHWLDPNRSILTSRPLVTSSGGNAKPQDTTRVRGRHCSLHGVRQVMLAERFGERDLPKIGAWRQLGKTRRQNHRQVPASYLLFLRSVAVRSCAAWLDL